LLLAVSAPTPPADFVVGVTGLPRGLDSALSDVRAAGFGAVRIFLRWDKIEAVEGAPDWTCGYTTRADLRDDSDAPWPGIPCDGTPCGCGYSPDELVAAAAGKGLPVVLTITGTPTWARGARAAHCPPDSHQRALPLRRDKETAYAAFVAQAARRYGDVVYAFELWSEPDLAGCAAWGGTRQEYKAQILAAADAVKATGVSPGLVIAPTLEDPSGPAMDAWMDWTKPVDLLSFNLYTRTPGEALGRIDDMNGWCRANPRCPGFYVTELGAQRTGTSHCPGPRTGAPGAADVAMLKRCRKRRWCAGAFLYTLSDRTVRPDCDRGLLDARGCRKRRLCTIARRFFRVPALPFACEGCGP
jgi:hypothetical protein